MNFFKTFYKKLIFLVLFLSINSVFLGAKVKKVSIKSASAKEFCKSYLAMKIDAIIDNNPTLHTGVEIYSTKQNRVIYSRNSDELFIPASNTKIFSSLMALEVLGSDYEFETKVYTDGVLDGDTINGNLYLVGSGDPSLTAFDVRSLINSLSKIGIKKINGDFCIDNTAFDSEYFAQGATIDCIGQPWFSCIDALIVDRKPLDISKLFVEQENEKESIIDVLDSEKFKFMFYNGVKIFEHAFDKNNIVLFGKIISKKLPEAKSLKVKSLSIVLNHKSKKLSQLLSVMMKDSDNLYADCIFKKVGAVRYNGCGTWQRGIDSLKSFLQNKVGINAGLIRISDGSGLSHYNLASPHQIVKLLSWAYRQEYYECFLKTLSVAGMDGTLKYRMSDLAPHVKAKTGSLAGVSALSGYVITRGDTLIFSILNSGYISRPAHNPKCKLQVEDAICRLLLN